MPAKLSIPTPEPAKNTLKGWHALLWFLGFFGFMFVVNGIFLWTAVTTFPGEDVEKSYLTGLDYNQELERRELQQEAGWTAGIGLTGNAPDLTLRIRLSARDGSPLPASSTRVELRHPADRNLDRALDLTPVGGGEYTAPMTGIAPGIWTVHFQADIIPSVEGMEFKATRALEVP